MEANFAFENFLNEGHFCEEDQTVYEDFIDELIRKYLFEDNMPSFYEETNINLESPETDKQVQAMFPIPNDHQDFMVPELLLEENMDVFLDKYGAVEPEEEIFSILEEIITEDENKEEHSAILAAKDPITKNKTTTPEITVRDTPKGTSYKKKRKRTRKDATGKKVKRFSRQLSPVKSRTAPRNKKE